MEFRIQDFETVPESGAVGRPKTLARVKGLFLKGPIPLSWLIKTTNLSKHALAAGLALWFQRGVSRSTGPVVIRAHVRRKFNLSANQMLRGLRSLEAASLVRFVKTGRGRCAVVEIIEATEENTSALPPPGEAQRLSSGARRAN